MESKRLTNSLRDTIRNKVLNHLYSNQLDELQAKLCQLAYERLYTPQIAALPQFLIKDGWIGTNDRLVLYEYEEGKRVDYNYFNLPSDIPCKSGNGRHSLDINMLDDNDNIVQVRKEYLQLYAAKEKTSQELYSLLQSCTTTKQLVETMPSLEPFVPHEARPVSLVPQATIDRLSAMLQGESL